jgi:predicted ArsR family transcriptional regulator
MTILDYLAANPGRHTASAVAGALGITPASARLELMRLVCDGKIIGHEQHGKIVFQSKDASDTSK